MGFQLRDSLHFGFQMTDFSGGRVEIPSGLRSAFRQIVIIRQAVVDQEVQRLCRFFQVEGFRPALIAFPFASGQLCLNVDNRVDFPAAPAFGRLFRRHSRVYRYLPGGRTL